MKHVLVSGAGGFVGTRLIERLATTYQVWALSRRPRSNTQNVHWLICDLADGGNLPVGLPKRVDAVIHLAQSERYRDFPAASREIWDVSATATQRMLAYALAAGARNAVVASTGGLYRTGDVAIPETGPLSGEGDSLGFYFAAKRASELVARSYEQHLITTTMRFFFVYGAGQRDVMLMPRLVQSIREGRPLNLKGDSGLRMNPVHVTDVVAAILRALETKHSFLVNIAGPEIVTLRDIGDTIGRLVGRRVNYEIDAAADPGHLVADITKMRQTLSSPQVGIAAGLAELISGTEIPRR